METRYSDRSVLLYIGTEVERIGESLGASEDTIVDAIRLCGDVLRADYEYDSTDSVAGACFYLACTRQDEPISLPDVADHARKSKKNIQHLSANLMSELEIQPDPIEPDTYIDEGVEEFGFTERQRSECYDLLERGKKRNLHSGFAPTTVAGAILYAVAKKHDLDIRQKDIADFVNKTTVSIRNSYKSFLKLAENVPVDVLPPQTIDEAIATLREEFPEYPKIYCDDTRAILNNADIADNASEAGAAGGAYLNVAQSHDEELAPSEVSDALGVGAQTIAAYSEEFNHDQ